MTKADCFRKRLSRFGEIFTGSLDSAIVEHSIAEPSFNYGSED